MGMSSVAVAESLQKWTHLMESAFLEHVERSFREDRLVGHTLEW